MNLLDAGSAVHLFPWVGSAAASVIAVALALLGVTAEANGLSVVLPGVGMDDAKKALAKRASSAPERIWRESKGVRFGLCNGQGQTNTCRTLSCVGYGVEETRKPFRRFRELRGSWRRTP